MLRAAGPRAWVPELGGLALDVRVQCFNCLGSDLIAAGFLHGGMVWGLD